LSGCHTIRKKWIEHDHNILADEEWYREQIQKGFKCKGVIFYQNKKMVGAG